VSSPAGSSIGIYAILARPVTQYLRDEARIHDLTAPFMLYESFLAISHLALHLLPALAVHRPGSTKEGNTFSPSSSSTVFFLAGA
jgi:hypothetical protein